MGGYERLDEARLALLGWWGLADDGGSALPGNLPDLPCVQEAACQLESQRCRGILEDRLVNCPGPGREPLH